MKCHCGDTIDHQEHLQIELKKKLEWLRREPEDIKQYTQLFKGCCSVCLSSMSRDMDGEIQAVLYHGDTYQDYKERFTILTPDSDDYKIVAGRFSSSVSNEILRIEAHNNSPLKKKYLAFKGTHNSTEGEKLLFHGSRHANYFGILNDGFDISRCKGGLQGVGVYFATNASYSIFGYAEGIMLEDDKGEELHSVGNMLCCYVYPTDDTGKQDNNYCIRNVDQCYPAFIVYYKL